MQFKVDRLEAGRWFLDRVGCISVVGAMQAHQLLRQGVLLFIAVLLAKSPLPPAGIGAYEMLLYLGFAVTFFWISGLSQGFLSLYPGIDAEARAGFLGQVYVWFTGLILLQVAGLWWFQQPALLLLTGQKNLTGYGLFLIFLLIHQPTYLLEHFYLAESRSRSIVRLSVVSAALQAAGVAIPAFMGWGISGILTGLLLFAVVRHIWLLVFLARSGAFRIRGRQWVSWLQLSLPLVLYALLGGFHATFDNWLVGWQYPGDDYRFAIFRYGARELPLAMALANALGVALLPTVAAAVNDSLPEVKRHTRRLFHQVFPLTIALLLSSFWWFPRVFSPEFLPSVPIFNLFLLLVISRVVPSRTILMGLHDNRSILVISVVELFVHLGLGLLLVSRFGLMGIAWSTIIAFVLEKLLHCIYLYHRYGISPGRFMDLPWLTGYSTLLLVAYVISLTIQV